MDLYAIHPDPENAPGYATRFDTVPEFVWARYRDQPDELKKREKALARETNYAYLYAVDVLRGPFPAGEAAIAKSAQLAYQYAALVLKGPFPVGEAAIATSPYYAFTYAMRNLKLSPTEAANWGKS